MTMTVRELLDLLETLDPELNILVSKDSEGNEYYPLDGYDIGAWDEDEERVGLVGLTDEDRRQGYTEEDVVDGPRVLVLVPDTHWRLHRPSPLGPSVHRAVGIVGTGEEDPT